MVQARLQHQLIASLHLQVQQVVQAASVARMLMHVSYETHWLETVWALKYLVQGMSHWQFLNHCQTMLAKYSTLFFTHN